MQFKGRLKAPGDAGRGVAVDLRIDDIYLFFTSAGEELGRFRVDDLEVERRTGNEFLLTIDEEEMLFLADDPLGFAYEGLGLIESVAARLKKKRRFRKGEPRREERRPAPAAESVPRPAPIIERASERVAGLSPARLLRPRPEPVPTALVPLEPEPEPGPSPMLRLGAYGGWIEQAMAQTGSEAASPAPAPDLEPAPASEEPWTPPFGAVGTLPTDLPPPVLAPSPTVPSPPAVPTAPPAGLPPAGAEPVPEAPAARSTPPPPTAAPPAPAAGPPAPPPEPVWVSTEPEFVVIQDVAAASYAAEVVVEEVAVRPAAPEPPEVEPPRPESDVVRPLRLVEPPVEERRAAAVGDVSAASEARVRRPKARHDRSYLEPPPTPFVREAEDDHLVFQPVVAEPAAGHPASPVEYAVQERAPTDRLPVVEPVAALPENVEAGPTGDEAPARPSGGEVAEPPPVDAWWDAGTAEPLVPDLGPREAESSSWEAASVEPLPSEAPVIEAAGAPEEPVAAASPEVSVEVVLSVGPAFPVEESEAVEVPPAPQAAPAPVVVPAPTPPAAPPPSGNGDGKKRRRREKGGHQHHFEEHKTVGGITRFICKDCGHVSFQGEDVYQGW